MYQRLTFNLVGGVRRETLEGRRHVVVPAAILAEGVISGSCGPIFYPEDEISKSASLWNHKPIVVYHPDKDGVPVSACDPVILNTRGIGRLLNVKYADNKLRAECWMEEDRLKSIDNRILTDLEAGKQVEVSTGLELDFEDSKGEWNKTEYKGIARNHRPDHLAALPDRTGAYSVKMGGGMLTVNRAREPESTQQVAQRSMAETLKRVGVVVSANDLSFGDISRQLCDLLSAKYGEPGKYWSGHVCDVYSNYLIFKGGHDEPMQMIGYKLENDTVSLEGDATEVEMKTEYVAANGAFVVNDGKLVPVTPPPVNGEEIPMAFDKKAHIANLITGSVGVWTEADRAFLDALPDAQLEKIKSPLQTQNAPPANPVPAVPGTTQDPRPGQQQQPVHPNAAGVSTDQYIANAPPHVREALQEAVNAVNGERDRLVADIVAYPLNQFPEVALKKTPLNQLRMLHNMIPRVPNIIESMAPIVGADCNLQPNFAGAAGGVVGNMALPTEFLPLPEFDTFLMGNK